jgi:hypothetical protein
MRFYGNVEDARAAARGSYREPIVEIGNAHGRIALYLDETEAIDLAGLYGSYDLAYEELLEAVEKAYSVDAGPQEDSRG